MRCRHVNFLLLAALGASGLVAQEMGDHIITGYVREEGSSEPIAAATLEISHSGGEAHPPVMTGLEGQFIFTALPEGEFVITARKSGFNPASASVSVMRTGTFEVTIMLRRTAVAGAHPGGPISAHQLSVPKKARADYEKGYRLLEDQNKPADSIPAFEKAVAAYPSYYEAYTELGIADSHVGKASEAEASLKKAIELSDGQFLQPLYVLAEVYNNQGKYQAAEPLARQAIAFDNSSWNGFLELARAQLGLKRIGEAETSAQQARELAPQTPQVYLVLANVHAIQQKYQTAVQDLDVYLKLDPNGQNSEAVRRTRERLQKQIQAAPGGNPPSTAKPAAAQP